MTVSDTITVGIVETQQLLRDALRALLESSANVRVVGDATGASDALAMIEATTPDVVVIGMDGGGEREFALLHQLPEFADRTHCLVLTSTRDPGLHSDAIELGARGVITRDQSGPAFLKALFKVCEGEIWLDRASTAGVVRRLTRRRVDDDPEAMKVESLTPRERQIVSLVTEGLTNRDIAERLFISEATARNHLTSILDKLELADRFQLTVYAFRRGLVICAHTPAMLRVAASMTSGRERTAEANEHAHPRRHRASNR